MSHISNKRVTIAKKIKVKKINGDNNQCLIKLSKRTSPKLGLTVVELSRLKKIGIKLMDIHTFDLVNFITATGFELTRCKTILASAKFQRLHGVGESLSKDMIELGYFDYLSLAKADAKKMYKNISIKSGKKHDPCVYDVFACAINQAKAITEQKNLDTEEYNWWYFSDKRPKDLLDFKIPTHHSIKKHKSL